MRLEHNDHPAIEPGARGSDHRSDLRWMVAVVVDHHHAAHFAAQLEAALGAAELGEGGRNAVEWHADFQRHGRRGQRV